MPHFHTTYAISVTRSGTGRFFTPSGTWDVSSRDIVVVGPHEVHWGSASLDGATYDMFYPSAEWLAEVVPLTADPAHRLVFHSPVVRNRSLSDRFLRAILLGLGGSSNSGLAEVTRELFGHYATIEQGGVNGGHEDWLNLALRNFDEVDTDVYRVQDVSAAHGYSRSHFSRRFRQSVGLAPVSYRRQARVVQARLMIEGGTNLIEAAYGAGFADQAHMTRQFRAILGYTPSCYFPAK